MKLYALDQMVMLAMILRSPNPPIPLYLSAFCISFRIFVVSEYREFKLIIASLQMTNCPEREMVMSGDKFLPYDAMLVRYIPSSCVCLCVLNIESRKQSHTTAQGL